MPTRPQRSVKLAAILATFLLGIALRHASAAPFSDLPDNHWAGQAVTTLSEKTLITGYPGHLFYGNRVMTRYETAEFLTHLLTYLEINRPIVPISELENLKSILAEYQDEIESMGLRISNLETAVDRLKTRIDETERVRAKGEFTSRFIHSEITGNPAGGIGLDTTYADAHPNRPYSLFPVKSGSAETTRAILDMTAKLNDQWNAGGRIAAFNSSGEGLNALAMGVTPPFFNNPLEGNVAGNNFKAALDKIFLTRDNETMTGELGTFYPHYSPHYLYAGVPNLTEEGPDFLPNYGGRLEANMRPYLFVTKAYSEIFAGKLAQSSPWQTQIFGANAGAELLGFGLAAHWMTAQNDPANFAGGTSGMIPVPINNGAGWINPTTLGSLVVGPQKEKVWGVDVTYSRSFHEHPVRGHLSYAHSDYKPNTNSSNDVGDELYDLGVEASTNENLTVGGKYLSIGAKYSPFILPFSLPGFVTLPNFPWAQWPFPVDFQGFYTLQNAAEYPQNRQGFKSYIEWTVPKTKINASYRWLTQKVPTQLTGFDNNVDIQSIGFYEPLFVAPGGGGPNIFPRGSTQDWIVSIHHDIRAPLAFEASASGVVATRKTMDAANVNLNGWLGHAGFIYSFWERWKLNLSYHRAQTNGRLLAAPTAAENFQFINNGETVRVDYGLTPQSDAFVQFRNLDHTQIQNTTNFHLIQFMTGLDFTF